MARQKKEVNYDGLIAEIDEKISKKEAEIKELRNQKKSLEEEKETTDLKKLRAAVIASGKTVDEVIAMLQ